MDVRCRYPPLRCAEVGRSSDARRSPPRTVYSQSIGPSGSVRAYEPFPPNAAALRRSVAMNGLDHVTVIEAAAADSSGTASFAG